MTIRIVNSVKYVGLFTLALLSIIACERDFENIGVQLVDNNQFDTKDTIFEIIVNTKNVVSSQVNQDDPTTRDIDGLTQYLLGVYKSDKFGLLKTTFVSQLGLPSKVDFGDNPSIDTIVLNIPYYSTKLADNSDRTPNFKLDSILGNRDAEYTLSVYELGTFLNALDPIDPTKKKRYFSDETYNKRAMLYSGMFKPNKNDTVLYVKRRFLDSDRNTVDDIDTVKTESVSPSIKLPLDTLFFRNNFINQQNSGVFDSNDSFLDYFRGILIEADGTDGALMTLAMVNASITIYYTNTELKDETDTDLNGNGTTDDTNVPVRTKQSLAFSLSGIRASQYNRDYADGEVNSFFDPNVNVTIGQEKIYVQGAAGSMAEIQLFRDADLEAIRNENWLINEANLTLYVDNPSIDTIVPNRLQLYNLDNNSQIRDVFTEAQINGIGGSLERDDNGNPYRYKFRITDYISEVLKSDNPLPLSRLGLKVFHPTDVPSAIIANDTLNKRFSWIAKGVVLKGFDPMNANDPQRIKLEIFYTINNE
jgi:hypothetical protein